MLEIKSRSSAVDDMIHAIGELESYLGSPDENRLDSLFKPTVKVIFLYEKVRLVLKYKFYSIGAVDLYQSGMDEQFREIEAYCQDKKKLWQDHNLGVDIDSLHDKLFRVIDTVRQALENYFTLLRGKLQRNSRRQQVIEETVGLINRNLSEFNDDFRREVWREISSIVNIDLGITERNNIDHSIEKYDTRPDKAEDIVQFLDRVYGQRGYLTGEFTRADLSKIDPAAVVALNNWEKGNKSRPKGRAPLNLPTRNELNDRLLDADPTTLTQFERAAQRRLKTIRKQSNNRSTKKLQFDR